MREIVVIDVPFDGFGREGAQASAAGAVHAAGLVERLRQRHGVQRAEPLSLPPFTTTPGPLTSLVNEPALLAMAEQLGARVLEAVDADRFPLVHGGDCSSLLGTVPALRASGPVGLLFLDGHEDATPVAANTDHEAANSELALLLGLTPSGPWGTGLPALAPEHLAVLGPRDDDWRAHLGVESLRGRVSTYADVGTLSADPGGTAGRAASDLHGSVGRWWLHVDLDVLDPESFPSQGLPGEADIPGGLTWEALTAALSAAIAVPGCLGWSLTIYDPDQDPDGADAHRIVGLVADVLAARAAATP